MNNSTNSIAFNELSNDELLSVDGGLVVSASICIGLFVIGYMIGEDID